MNSIPLYIDIAGQIKHRIISGTIGSNGVLPVEKTLAQDFGASRVTIRKAIKLLIEEGLLESRQGSGTYILEGTPANNFANIYNLNSIKSFRSEMSDSGLNFRNDVTEFKIINAPIKILDKLKLDNVDKTYFIRRVKYINGNCSVCESSYMPLNLFSDLSFEDMEYSKYHYVEKKKGLRISHRSTEIHAVNPPEDIMVLFDLKKSNPVLFTTEIAYLSDGRAFDYSEIYFNPENYLFRLTST